MTPAINTLKNQITTADAALATADAATLELENLTPVARPANWEAAYRKAIRIRTVRHGEVALLRLKLATAELEMTLADDRERMADAINAFTAAEYANA